MESQSAEGYNYLRGIFSLPNWTWTRRQVDVDKGKAEMADSLMQCEGNARTVLSKTTLKSDTHTLVTNLGKPLSRFLQ